MDQEAINRDLRERSSDSPLQQKLLKELLSYIKASSDEMSRHWDSWDRMDQVYRGYRVPDREDAEAYEKKEPTKILIPITYAQTQTALSFFMSMFMQKEHFFEISPMGPEDQMPAMGMEIDLDYQMRRQQFLFKLYSWLLDACKVGFGVVKPSWEVETVKMRTQRAATPTGLLASVGAALGLTQNTTFEEVVEEVPSYEGNKITNISPYSFFPDPDLPLAKFQEGAFVAHEEEVSRVSISAEEGNLYHGTDHIQDSIPTDVFDSRKRRAGRQWKDVLGRKSVHGIESVKSCIRTEVQFEMIPNEWTKATGINFGDERQPVKMIATLINDSKIVRFEPLNYLHGQYTYSVIEYSPDHNRFINPGLAETIHELQNLMTWFLNSHVVNVREVIKNRFLVDPNRVHLNDISSNKRYIRTKTSTGDFDRVIKPLSVPDVTAGHVGDVDMLSRLVQVVTGINENALGQYASGRRSATESRNVNAGAAARLKMHATLAWMQGIAPLGRQLVSNTRQGRSREFYDLIVGGKQNTAPYEATILADPSKIAGGFDLKLFEGALPSEKHQKASVLTELFTVLIQNPDSITLLRKDPSKLIHHIAELYNIHLEDFELDPQGGEAPVAQVVPDDVALAAAEGGAQPVDVMGEDLLQQLANQ